MRVIFCYTHEPESRSAEAVTKYAPQAEWLDTSATIYTYNEVIASRWDCGEDLVVIEGDKEITSEVLPSFEHCPKLWCSFSAYVFPAAIEHEYYNGLGCTRYSERLQRIVDKSEFMVPDSPMWALCPVCGGKGCYRYLDSRIALAIRMHITPTGDINVHRHGRVEHHHDYSGQTIEVMGAQVPCDILADKLLTVSLQHSKSQPRSAEEMQAIDNEFAGPGWPPS